MWAAQAWGQSHALTVAVAAAMLVLSVVMSIVLLVPINSRVAGTDSWTSSKSGSTQHKL